MPMSPTGSEASLKRSDEHGFTPVRRPAEHGFTLIELMVVITIIGLASAAVVLAMPDPRGRLSDQADRFAARVRVAHDMAILDGRTTSVWIAPGGYGFDLRTRDGWQPMPQDDRQRMRDEMRGRRDAYGSTGQYGGGDGRGQRGGRY